MKLLTGWVIAAGLVFTAMAAHAQGLPPSAAVSDIEEPYAGMPVPAPRYGGPIMLPPAEVYVVARESGFRPLGVPQLRGFVYTMPVIDRGGDDGRLVIDARTGRILRFMPAYRRGDDFSEDFVPGYGYGRDRPPLFDAVRGPPRPPRSVPHVASRSVPTPKISPLHGDDAKPLADKAAEPPLQSAAVQTKPADVQPAAPAAAAAKPTAPPIQPTREMPKVQGLE